MERLRAYPALLFQLPPQNRRNSGQPSPIDLGLGLRTEAFDLSRKMTLVTIARAQWLERLLN